MATADLRIEAFDIAILGSTIDSAVDQWRQGFLGQAAADGEHWDDIFQKSMSLVERGRQNAFLVPAAHFMIATTMDILGRPEVAQQLPKEVIDRVIAPRQVIEQIAIVSIAQGDLTDAYQRRGVLERGTRVDIRDLSRYSAMSNLVGQALSDASTLAGGALRFLRQEIPGYAHTTEAIQRSLGLFAAAKVCQEVVPELYAALGYPYVTSDRLELKTDDNGPRVDFNRATRELIEACTSPGSGCPAGRVTLPGTTSSLLKTDGQVMTGYLVPPDATVDRYLDPVLKAAGR